MRSQIIALSLMFLTSQAANGDVVEGFNRGGGAVNWNTPNSPTTIRWQAETLGGQAFADVTRTLTEVDQTFTIHRAEPGIDWGVLEHNWEREFSLHIHFRRSCRCA